MGAPLGAGLHIGREGCAQSLTAPNLNLQATQILPIHFSHAAAVVRQALCCDLLSFSPGLGLQPPFSITLRCQGAPRLFQPKLNRVRRIPCSAHSPPGLPASARGSRLTTVCSARFSPCLAFCVLLTLLALAVSHHTKCQQCLTMLVASAWPSFSRGECG